MSLGRNEPIGTFRYEPLKGLGRNERIGTFRHEPLKGLGLYEPIGTHPDRVAAEKPLLPFPPLQAIGHVPESVFKPNAVRVGLSHGRQFNDTGIGADAVGHFADMMGQSRELF